jgi:glycosyltransferase involved in cell wall biosynthesis
MANHGITDFEVDAFNQKIMSPQTILYLITASEHGGAQKYVGDLATHAATQFKKVYLLYGAQGRGEAFKNLPDNVAQHMWPSLVRSIHPYQDLLFLLKLIKFFKKHHIDVIHCNSSKAGFLGRFAAKICRVPCVVYTVHGYVFREPLPMPIKILYWFLEYCAAAWTHVQISVNREDADYTQRKFKAKKVVWIPNGISVQSADPQKQRTFQAQWNMQPQQKKIGTVANFYATKNHAGFLDVFKNLVEHDQNFQS